MGKQPVTRLSRCVEKAMIEYLENNPPPGRKVKTVENNDKKKKTFPLSEKIEASFPQRGNTSSLKRAFDYLKGKGCLPSNMQWNFLKVYNDKASAVDTFKDIVICAEVWSSHKTYT
jgi:hypothetical protein